MAAAKVMDHSFMSTQGFDFSNVNRNLNLESAGFHQPKAKKTGTTIVGAIFKDGVVLGADTRATSGNIVADKFCLKIHKAGPNMYCCGAGCAADTEQITKLLYSQMNLDRLNEGREPPVCSACRWLKQRLFRYQGHIEAALILGGVDADGPYIYSVHPHGSVDRLPYLTSGSGSLAAMSVLEHNWKPNMELEEVKKLVYEAVSAGVFNDLGSGSNVDLCVIKDGVKDMIRPYKAENPKPERQGNYTPAKGQTQILKKDFVVVKREIQYFSPGATEGQMDTA